MVQLLNVFNSVILLCILLVISMPIRAEYTIPNLSGVEPTGIVLQGNYVDYEQLELLSSTFDQVNADEKLKLLRQYVLYLGEGSKDKLVKLFYSEDGSRDRYTESVNPKFFNKNFEISSAKVNASFQWSGIYLFDLSITGSIKFKKSTPLSLFCKNEKECYLLFSNSIFRDEQVSMLYKIFKNYSQPNNGLVDIEKFVARAESIRYQLKTDYKYPSGELVELFFLLKRYSPAVLYFDDTVLEQKADIPLEIKTIIDVFNRFRSIDENELTGGGDILDEMIKREFNSEYANKLRYGVAELINGEYIVTSLPPNKYIKEIKQWRDIRPAGYVRHGKVIYVYVRVTKNDMQIMQLIPVKVLKNGYQIDARKYTDYTSALMRSPDMLSLIDKKLPMVGAVSGKDLNARDTDKTETIDSTKDKIYGVNTTILIVFIVIMVFVILIIMRVKRP